MVRESDLAGIRDVTDHSLVVCFTPVKVSNHASSRRRTTASDLELECYLEQ